MWMNYGNVLRSQVFPSEEKKTWEERKDTGPDAHICCSSVLLEIR